MWCGVVWCGVVWSGLVWCGVVWCGVVWCGVVWCGVVCRMGCYQIAMARMLPHTVKCKTGELCVQACAVCNVFHTCDRGPSLSLVPDGCPGDTLPLCLVLPKCLLGPGLCASGP